MQPADIFALGHDRTRWLAARLSALSSNVANADTPGYKARDVQPFEAVLNSASVDAARTQFGNAGSDGSSGNIYDHILRPSQGGKHSGNAVSLEVEMAGIGEVRGQQAAVTGILGAFHRLLLSVTKG